MQTEPQRHAQTENLWTIGPVADTPHPIVVNQNLRNVPENGHWVRDSLWIWARDPETFSCGRWTGQRKGGVHHMHSPCSLRPSDDGTPILGEDCRSPLLKGDSMG